MTIYKLKHFKTTLTKDQQIQIKGGINDNVDIIIMEDVDTF